MTVRKLVSLDDATAAAARAAARSEGLSLSDWLANAARSATTQPTAASRQLSQETWRRADHTAHNLGLDAFRV